MTDAVLWELRDLTALTTLHLNYCPDVTDVANTLLPSRLTNLWLAGTSTTQAGRDALKAALPALTINSNQPAPSPAGCEYHP